MYALVNLLAKLRREVPINAAAALELWRGPLAVAFDTKVVAATGKPEPSLLAPVGPPRVAADPVVLSVLSAVPRDRDGVILGGAAGGILEDASRVSLEGW